MSGEKKIGPNVRKLIVEKMSHDAIPSGGGLADGIGFLSDPKKISDGVKKATQWVETALIAVRKAQEPNEFKNADDETIAAEILQKIEERRASRLKPKEI